MPPRSGPVLAMRASAAEREEGREEREEGREERGEEQRREERGSP